MNLRPCPFCANPATWNTIRREARGGEGEVPYTLNHFTAGCSNDACSIKPGTPEVSTLAGAYQLWNERAVVH